jgi:hypothetical protein
MENPPLRIVPGSSYTHLEQNTTRQNSEGPYQFRWVVGGVDYYYLFCKLEHQSSQRKKGISLTLRNSFLRRLLQQAQ